MAWESRRGRMYYYAKERVGDRVISRYLGNGEAARLCEAATLEAKGPDSRQTDVAAQILGIHRGADSDTKGAYRRALAGARGGCV